jgi:hypothetical protein
MSGIAGEQRLFVEQVIFRCFDYIGERWPTGESGNGACVAANTCGIRRGGQIPPWARAAGALAAKRRACPRCAARVGGRRQVPGTPPSWYLAWSRQGSCRVRAPGGSGLPGGSPGGLSSPASGSGMRHNEVVLSADTGMHLWSPDVVASGHSRLLPLLAPSQWVRIGESIGSTPTLDFCYDRTCGTIITITPHNPSTRSAYRSCNERTRATWRSAAHRVGGRPRDHPPRGSLVDSCGFDAQ